MKFFPTESRPIVLKNLALLCCIFALAGSAIAQPYTLTVARSGIGGGTVSSAPAGISCGATCTAAFPADATVTLTAVPDATSSFSGWSGAAAGTNSQATITMDSDKSVTALFTRNSYTLTVSMTGTGSGSVTSNPAGIACPGDCAENYQAGTTVTLSATPSAGSVFSGWSGGGCSGTGTCNVSMMSVTSVTAVFDYTGNSYYADNDGDGYGAGDAIIASVQPPNTSINNMDCDDNNLFVHPGATEICSNGKDEDCNGVVDDCDAYTLTVARSGIGGGTVTSTPAGISCGATCTAAFPADAAVILTATPDATSSFGGWSGAATGTNSQATITMDSDKSVTALFTRNSYALTVSMTGTGSGSVTTNPAGIACPGDCAENYQAGTTVTLTATPSAGSVFSGWSGGGCTGTGTCTVSVMSIATVTAGFCRLPDAPGIISGNNRVCEGTSQTYDIQPVTNATTYTWTLPPGWIGNSTSNSMTATSGSSGTLRVTANNSCGAGPVQTLDVTVDRMPADLIKTNGLVAYYPFNNNAADESGNGNNGTVSGASLVNDRFGNANAAYDFNGSSNYIDLGDKDLLNPHLNDMTVSAWAKKDVTVQHARIYSKGTHGGSQPGYDLMFYGSAVPTRAAVIFSAGGHEHIAYSNNPVSDLSWHHYAGVINRKGYLSFYVDGVKQNDSISISAHQMYDVGTNTLNAFMGASYSNNWNPGPINEYFDGSIDDIHVYRRVLRTSEIYALYNPLTVYAADDTLCMNSSTEIHLVNPENEVSYQLQKNGNAVGNPQSGNGDTLRFNTGTLTSTALFTIKAVRIGSSCEIVLDTVLTITVNPAYAFNEDDTICAGEIYPWHGTACSAAGTYTAHYNTIHGCDSIYTLHLIVNPVFAFIENHAICEGETYTWQGTDYNDGGTYTASYNTIHGCDSIYTLNLAIHPVFNFSENHAICEGETYTWHGTDYTDGGTYTASYNTIHGCDSMYVLNLTVNTVDVSVTSNGPVITAGATGATYQWLDCDDDFSIIDGETAQSFTAATGGNYCVEITQGACTDTSECIRITPVGINTLQNEGISIFPNPVTHELIIENKGSREKISFEMMNSSGQVVYKGDLYEKTIVNTSDFYPGIYLIKLKNGISFEIKKVIKE